MRNSESEHWLELPAEHRVDRVWAGAADQEVEHDDPPEQRIFEAFQVPQEPELDVIDDGRGEEDEDRERYQAGEKADGEADAAKEFHGSHHIVPQQPGLEAVLLEPLGHLL